MDALGHVTKKETPSPEEGLEQVKKIAASKGFSNSDPIRKVLLYLAKRAIEQPGNTIKEYELATQVLECPANFEPVNQREKLDKRSWGNGEEGL